MPMALHSRLRQFEGRGGRRPVARVAAEAATLMDPDDDPRIPAEFRLDLVRTLTARALRAAIGRARR